VRDVPHVAVLIETSRSFGRGLLEGVAQYIQQHEPWSMYFEPRGLADPPPEWLGTWKGDGILARIDHRQMAQAVLRTGLPVVDLRERLPDLGLSYVGTDNCATMRLPVEHFADCGFRNFAFCRVARDTHPHVEECQTYFRRHVEAAGHRYFCNEPRAQRSPGPSWEEEQAQLAEWIRSLPKPIGVMTRTDDTGYQVLDACRRAGVLVPDDVALASSSNDTVVCNLSNPPLTSVDINAERIGYEATALLARLMRQPRRHRKPVRILIPPRGIVVRQSSDVLAIADREVAAAVRFIRERACDRITVKDVLRHVSLSRSVLDLRFKMALGRTPKGEILRVQLSRARQLLAESNLTLEAIAARSGFGTANYLGDTFLRELGMRPGEYRRRFQRVG
jgi:LacI family transcriptional regulator